MLSGDLVTLPATYACGDHAKQPDRCGFVAQEVPQTELQPLSTVAKSAAALLKYLPLPAALLPRATATLADGVRATLWPTRAAALVFAQVHHFFWPFWPCTVLR